MKKNIKIQLFPYLAFGATFKNFFGLFKILLRSLMPKNSSGMQKSYFWTGFLHKKSTNRKSHSESLCTVSSCEKWQAISPLLRLTFSEVWTFSKDKNLYGNRAKLRWKVDCNFRICIEINEAVRSTWHWLLRQSTEMDLALCTLHFAPENEFVTLWEIINNVLLKFFWLVYSYQIFSEFNRFLLIKQKQFVKYYSK